MTEYTHNKKVELICIIANDGMSEAILKFARASGITGGTVTMGHGTVRSPILEFIGLADVRREILYLLAERDLAWSVLEKISRRFSLHKRNHGIAFTTSICDVVGSKNIICEDLEDEEHMDAVNYHIINVIVDKGRAEEVVAAAEGAGSKGGTIINARGAGVHEVGRVFSMDIEPEKEIILILSEVAMTHRIVDAVSRQLKIDEPGNGIIYIQNANRTYGIFK